jgi:hypothetical protein
MQFVVGMGAFPVPLALRPDLWLRFSTRVDAEALLAMTKASLTPNCEIVDETALETGITLADPNQAVRIWSIKGVVTMADGRQAKLDEWVGDVWDRRLSPGWEDRNPNAMYNPAGGPFLSVRLDFNGLATPDPVTGQPATMGEAEMIWQAAAADVKRSPDGTPL